MKLYSKDDFLKAAELGEVSMIDARHVVSLLDEVTAVNEPGIGSVTGCVPGCHYFTGGEVKHHKYCQNYKSKTVTDSNVMPAEEYLDNNVLMIGKRFTRDDVEKFMELYAGYVAEIKAKDVACKFIDDISEEWHRDADGWKNVMNAKVPESLRITAEQLYERWKEAQK